MGPGCLRQRCSCIARQSADNMADEPRPWPAAWADLTPRCPQLAEITDRDIPVTAARQSARDVGVNAALNIGHEDKFRAKLRAKSHKDRWPDNEQVVALCCGETSADTLDSTRFHRDWRVPQQMALHVVGRLTCVAVWRSRALPPLQAGGGRRHHPRLCYSSHRRQSRPKWLPGQLNALLTRVGFRAHVQMDCGILGASVLL